MSLKECREKLRDFIDGETLFNEPLFETWIHEKEHSGSGRDAYEDALYEARRCHVLLVLYNGQAGSVARDGEVGICQRELEAGLGQNPDKVYVIWLKRIADLPSDSKRRKRDKKFRDYVEKIEKLPLGPPVDSYEELEQAVGQILRRAIAKEAKVGAQQLARSRLAFGAALDWVHLDYLGRKGELERVCAEVLIDRGAQPLSHPRNLRYLIGNQAALFRCHGAPAALSVPAARELVGQPSFEDVTLHEEMEAEGLVGPVHLIACHRRVTETQALKILGVTDATIVNADFGIYLAEETHKIQLVFLSDCRNETRTGEAIGRFFTWLERSGEIELFTRRAASRARIVAAIARESAPAMPQSPREAP